MKNRFWEYIENNCDFIESQNKFDEELDPEEPEASEVPEEDEDPDGDFDFDINRYDEDEFER